MNATMTKPRDAAEAVSRVRSVADSIKCDELQHFPEAASFGDSVRQGDVYVQLIRQVPPGYVQVKPETLTEADRQVAQGNSQGSRHILSTIEPSDVLLFRRENGVGDGLLDGPVIQVLADDGIVLTHPEHGDWQLPRGTYAISYQRELDELDEARRVID